GVDPEGGTLDLAEFLTRVHPDDRAELVAMQERVIKTGEEAHAIFRSNPDDGRLHYYSCHTRAIRNGDGLIERLSGVTQDITAQKEAERERMELEDRLRQAQKLEAVGRLAGGIAHDFNNILHALLGYCRLARESQSDDP